MADRGHRALPHTADVRLEAWAPTVTGCLEEAAAALIGLFLDARGAATVDVRSFELEAGSLESMLLGVLDEVIFALDTGPEVPLRLTAAEREGGGIDGRLALGRPDSVEPTGSVPKGISRSELTVEQRPGRVACRFLVDV